jgi:hypothetical protein
MENNNFLKIVLIVVVTLGIMGFLATLNQPSNETKVEITK